MPQRSWQKKVPAVGCLVLPMPRILTPPHSLVVMGNEKVAACVDSLTIDATICTADVQRRRVACLAHLVYTLHVHEATDVDASVWRGILNRFVVIVPVIAPQASAWHICNCIGKLWRLAGRACDQQALLQALAALIKVVTVHDSDIVAAAVDIVCDMQFGHCAGAAVQFMCSIFAATRRVKCPVFLHHAAVLVTCMHGCTEVRHVIRKNKVLGYVLACVPWSLWCRRPSWCAHVLCKLQFAVDYWHPSHGMPIGLESWLLSTPPSSSLDMTPVHRTLIARARLWPCKS